MGKRKKSTQNSENPSKMQKMTDSKQSLPTLHQPPHTPIMWNDAVSLRENIDLNPVLDVKPSEIIPQEPNRLMLDPCPDVFPLDPSNDLFDSIREFSNEKFNWNFDNLPNM